MKKLQIILCALLVNITGVAQSRLPKLIDLAKTTFEVVKLDPTYPSPDCEWMGGNALNLTAKSIKCSLWGPPDIITFSLSKNDVWDRRYFCKPVLKLQQMIDSVQNGNWNQHYYNTYNAYDFPCQKPVGQIQIRCPELRNAQAPEAKLAMSDGIVTITAVDSNASLKVKFANMMTKDVMILRGELKGIPELTIRLYRHFDIIKSGGRWWTGGGQPLKGFDYTAYKGKDDPLKPPTSGVEGKIVWVRQDMPAEKTFPKGFSYLFAAILKEGKATFATKEGYDLASKMEISEVHKEKLGANKFQGYLPKYELINKAMGVAADINIKSNQMARISN